jgi:hypothetical protein
MSQQDTPRAADGAKLCAWCGGPVKQSGVGRSRDYCRRSCRQRAYEARKQREAVVAAVASAVARRDSSRVEIRSPNDSSRDETVRTVRPQVPAPPAPPVVPAAPVVQELPPLRQSRRRAGMQAAAMPLPGLEPEAADGE